MSKELLFSRNLFQQGLIILPEPFLWLSKTIFSVVFAITYTLVAAGS